MEKQQMDEKAFRQMVGRQRDLLWRLCAHYRLGAAWEVEDAWHEVLCMLWTKRNSFDGRCTERTWAFRVATNTLNSLYRRRSNQPLPSAEEVGDSIGYQAVYPDMAFLVDALDEPDRSIVWAHYMGFSRAETAAATGLNGGAVAMRLHRALKKLRKQYSNR